MIGLSISERECKLKKIALDLYQRCKDERLSLGEFKHVLWLAKRLTESEARL